MLVVREVDKSQAEAKRRRLVSDFTGELEPLTIGRLQFEGDHFADLGFAEAVDVTAAFRQISNAGEVISALTVPNRVETNVPSFFGSAVAHDVSQRLLFWRLAFGRWAGELPDLPDSFYPISQIL